MSELQHIRKVVLGLSQADMAKIAGVTQATVSRWEAGLSEPDRAEMKRIRDEAARCGKPWSDGWFFMPPSSANAASNSEAA